MFKLVPTVTLPFEPSSTADFCECVLTHISALTSNGFSVFDGNKVTLICTESGQGGIFLQRNDELRPCITAVQAKQCCVIEEMRIALVLVAKV